jgi:hypothetical protein
MSSVSGKSQSPILCAVPNIASEGLVLMPDCRATTQNFALWLFL